MQYADIALNSKTANLDLFTYSIPAKELPYLNPGSIVEVRLSNRKILGVIFKIKKQVKGISKDRLKPIIRIVDSDPILDKNRLELAKELANYQLSSLGKVVFSMIPEPARRKGSKKPFEIDSNNIKKGNKLPLLFTGNIKQRVDFYQQIIKKNQKQGGRSIILVPNFNSSKTKKIKNKFPSAKFYHSNLTRTKRYQLWQEAKKGQIDILIGTQQAIFTPIPKLSLIIVDQATEDLYKSQQEPYFDYRKLASILTKKIDSTLVFGDQLPYFEHYIKTKTSNWKFIKSPKEKQGNNSSIVNLNKERSLLSAPLKRELKKTLNAKQKALLYLNRTGNRNLGICLDCQKAHYIKKSSLLSCKKCKSKNIKYVSLGVTGFKELVEKEFPQSKIIKLQSTDDKTNYHHLKKGQFDILIATSAISNFNFKFDLSCLVLPDIGLNLPSYNSIEKSFYQLFKVLKLSNNQLIQTFNPENKAISNLCRLDYKSFYDKLEEERLANKQPPFSIIAKIYSRKKPYLDNLEKVRGEIEDWRKINNLKFTLTELIEPIFFKWPYFLLKIDKEPSLKLREKLTSLPIQIDRDPNNLI